MESNFKIFATLFQFIFSIVFFYWVLKITVFSKRRKHKCKYTPLTFIIPKGYRYFDAKKKNKEHDHLNIWMVFFIMMVRELQFFLGIFPQIVKIEKKHFLHRKAMIIQLPF